MNKDKIQKVINTLVMSRGYVEFAAEFSAIKESLAIMQEELGKPEQEPICAHRAKRYARLIKLAKKNYQQESR